MPSTTLSRGNIIASFVIAPALTPVSVAGAISAEQNFTIPGIQVGDFVDVYAQVAQTAGIGISNSRVSAANILTVSFSNTTAGALVPVAGSYAMIISRPESLPLPTTAA